MASVKKNAALKTAVNKIHIILDRVGDLTSLDGTVILTNELMSFEIYAATAKKTSIASIHSGKKKSLR